MSDFSFVGGAYEAPSIYQDAQELINWYCEIDQNKAGSPTTPAQRGAVALYPTPGFTLAIQLAAGEVRAMHTCSGGNVLLVVSGSSFYSVSTSLVATYRGAMASSTGFVSIADDGPYAMIVDGSNRYGYNISTGVFAQLDTTDGAFVGGSVVTCVDNYFIYNRQDTQQFAASDALSVVTQPLSFSSKDGSPDNLVAIAAVNRELYLLGEVSSEVWIDVGSFPFPFSRIPGSNTQHGCAAAGSVSRAGESIAFVSRDERGQGIIVHGQGYSFKRLSTHAVEHTLLDQEISNARAFTYQSGGHEFYVVTFPSIDLTWVYDLASDNWHKWLSWDIDGSFHRHRAQCSAVFQGKTLVGDYSTGAIYQLSTSVYDESGNTIRRLRRAPHLVNDFKRQFFYFLQIQFHPGVGDDSLTQGADPQCMLRWSDDGGSTWSSEHWRSIGRQGKFKDRAVWRRLGTARDRIFEVSITDPVRAVIISADLRGSEADN